MKILLDECVDKRLAPEIRGHTVKAVSDMGWKGILNGDLLILASKEFDVFISIDQNLPFQQQLSAVNIAVLILKAPPNKLSDLKRLIPKILVELPNAKPGQVVNVGN